jgi:hypothetical protein
MKAINSYFELFFFLRLFLIHDGGMHLFGAASLTADEEFA